MHAGTAASPQQIGNVRQPNTKQSAAGRTMAPSKDQQTASSRTLDWVLRPLKYLQRRVLLLLCWMIEGCCVDSLSGVCCWGKEVTGGRKKKEKKKVNHFLSLKITLFALSWSVCLQMKFTWREEMHRGVWSLKESEDGWILHNPSLSVQTDNNTSVMLQRILLRPDSIC